MKLTKSKLTLLIFASIATGILLYYLSSETNMIPLFAEEEDVPAEFFEVDEVINSESLEVLEDFKVATETMQKTSMEKDDKSMVYNDYLEMIDTVTLINEFRKLLDPDVFKCGFNKRLSKKIKGKNGWIPSQIKLSTEDSVKMNKNVLKFNESSSAYIFNLFSIKGEFTDNAGNHIDTVIQAVPEGSILFADNKAFNFLNKERSSFVVNFDCDGYYKAAVSAGLGGGKGNLKSNANASQGKKISAFVGMAYIYSPLQYIMEPASIKINGIIPNYEKFSHLASVLAVPRILQISDFSITPIQQLKMVWASNSGTSTMNQRVDIAASANLGVFSAQADGSVTVNRGASYNNYNSYLIGKVNSHVGTYSKEDISKRMAETFASIELEELPTWKNRDLVFSIRINEGYCNKVRNEWEIVENGFNLVNMTVSPNNQNLCEFVIEGSIDSNLKRITLKGKIEGQEVYRVIDLPIL